VRVDDIARRNAVFFGDDEALRVPATRPASTPAPLDGRASTWSELDERANRYARMLAELGVAKGERVVMFAPNCGEYLDFFFGSGRSGTVGASVNVRLAPEEIAAYLQLVEPAAAIIHGALDAPWLTDLPSLRHVIGCGPGHGRRIDLEEALAAQLSGDPGVAVSGDDPYQLAATSGTTGIPKAAVKTHRNALAAMLNWMAELPIRERGTYLQCIPMFFNPGGPAGIHPVLMKGGRSVLYPSFDPGQWIAAVAEHGVTDSTLVPTMVQMIVSHPDASASALESIERIVIGGAPLPRTLLLRARELLGDVFHPFYGMAETYSCGLALRRENQLTDGTDAEVARLGSAGKPMALIQLRVIDSQGREVPHDNATAGEIQMAGDSVSGEYFRMPQETAAVHDGGWLRTGDIAVVDADGFVTIVDRSKDIIITGGINVYSREIEDALHAHPAVLAAEAIGIPHERWGEAIHAVVVIDVGAQATEDELLAFAAARLASYKKPRSLEIVPALPINANGKILKRELRAAYAGPMPLTRR
jgi:acyl-CoA synthetase (AMP-forming)/AMP-acid ligase II